jgi:hypothetical protein
LHKLNFVSFSRPLSLFLLSIFCSSILLLVPFQVQAQNQERQYPKDQASAADQVAKDLLPVNLGADWVADGPARVLDSRQWDVLPNADVYAEYGLQKLTSRIYRDKSGKSKATVEIFDMQFESGSYGLFTFNRGSLSPNRHEFQTGRYLVSIAGDQNQKPVSSSLVEALKQTITNTAGKLPFLPSHLPEQNKIPESEKYMVGPAAIAQAKDFSHLKDVINFDGGVEVVTADYQNGSGRMGLIIIEYHTPQSASDGYAGVLKHLTSLDQAEKDRSFIKRIGNYVVKVVNVNDLPEAEKIVSQIKYSPQVYWSGRKLSDIPMDFRPLEPVAVEEATKTLKVLVRSFFWVGVMLTGSVMIGLIAGGSYFYWRRYRRRKLGLDEIFSDAGDLVRLNLDDFLLESKEPSIKKIGDGK